MLKYRSHIVSYSLQCIKADVNVKL